MTHPDDLTIEWRRHPDGRISDGRVTRGKALYRLPWWRRLLKPWRLIRYRSNPSVPFPADNRHISPPMTDPFLSQVTPPLKFGEQSITSPPYLLPDPSLPVIQAVKNSCPLKPGWHSATVTFELDEEGNTLRVDEYKISSFGVDRPGHHNDHNGDHP